MNRFCLLILIVLQLACAGTQDRTPPAELIDQLNGQRTEAARLLERENYSEALEILREVNRQLPDHAETLGLLAWAQWHTGDPAGAVANFENSIRGNYSDYLTHLRFAQVLLDTGKSGRALTEFRLATELGGKEPTPYYNYGLALHRLGRLDQARAAWQQAYDLDNDNPLYLEAMGIGLAGLDDERALEYFERAYALGRSGAAFGHNYAQVLGRLGHRGPAEKKYLEAIELAPDRLDYRFDLAAFYMNSGSFEQALTHWRYLVKRQPEEPAPRIYLARAYLELARYGEAITALEPLKPAEGRPAADRQDEVFNILAMSHRGLKQLDEANLFIESALELKPDQVDYLINYGVILADRGMMDRARAQWLRALEIDPGNQTAQRNLSAFER